VGHLGVRLGARSQDASTIGNELESLLFTLDPSRSIGKLHVPIPSASNDWLRLDIENTRERGSHLDP
jgi:hypothetical protein